MERHLCSFHSLAHSVIRWGGYSWDCLWISRSGARPWSDLISHHFVLCPQPSGLKGVFVGLPPRPCEEPESSVSLYKQVQGSEIPHSLVALEGRPCQGSVGGCQPCLKKTTEPRDRMSTDARQPGRVLWILKPEGVQASLDPAGCYPMWVEAVPSRPSPLQGEPFAPGRANSVIPRNFTNSDSGGIPERVTPE